MSHYLPKHSFPYSKTHFLCSASQGSRNLHRYNWNNYVDRISLGYNSCNTTYAWTAPGYTTTYPWQYALPGVVASGLVLENFESQWLGGLLSFEIYELAVDNNHGEYFFNIHDGVSSLCYVSWRVVINTQNVDYFQVISDSIDKGQLTFGSSGGLSAAVVTVNTKFNQGRLFQLSNSFQCVKFNHPVS